MYINKIDNLFDGIINKFYDFTKKKNIFEKFLKDDNFVKFQNEILNYIKDFITEINRKEILDIIENDKYVDTIINIIKRYCAFYIYLGIGYNFKGGRDLYVTNIIETSKNQKDSTFKIENFYNSENNSKIIDMYQLIKNIEELQKFKTMDRIKIILNNNPIKYNDTIDLFNDLGEEFIVDYFLINDNFHNIIKTFIFRMIYLNEEKNDIIKMLNEQELSDAEYKYIEVVVSNVKKLIDFTFFQTFLTTNELRKGLAEDYYEYLEENKYEEEKIVNTNMIVDFLFSNNFIVPITEEFIRFHKDTEKYDKKENMDKKDREATKIKYIINKINKVKNYYSEAYIKNPNLKLNAKELYYKPLEYREAVLYNNNEEIKIIQKLEFSKQSSDLDYLVDLENIKSYAYINYKDLSKDGFILRPTVAIQSIRHSSMKKKDKSIKNNKFEFRIGHSNLPLHVIGIVLNPSGKSLECFNQTDLKNVKENKKNGYTAFVDLIDTMDSKDNNLYYWMFNNEEDIVELTEYKNVSIFEKSKYIVNMLAELYQYFINIVKNNIIKKLKKEKSLNLWKTDMIIKEITDKKIILNNVNLKINKIIVNELLDRILKEKEYVVKDEYIDEKDIIKIPTSEKIKKSIKLIVLTDKKEEEIKLDEYLTKPVCHHYIKWINIKKIPRKNDEELNQAIFNFVKQYVKVDENGDYICKSCDEMLDLKKYVYEGTYVEELDTFLTTNLATNKNLYDIPKYAKYTRTIRNVEKNIEKFCYSTGLNYYLGNTPVIKLRRKMIIKDAIDLILIHTEYLKNQPKDRIARASSNYNINKDLTNLFFFELKDDIFLTSSTDTDYYKIIKYNNVIAYIVLVILTDINAGMVLSLKDDKKCNYFLYDKVGRTLFENLFIRLNEKEKIPVTSIPLLGYVLFYFSCILTNNYIWLWNSNEKSGQYNIQKIIINTMIDLINTLMEANMQENKNFLYELIVNRLIHKFKTVYNDTNVLNTISEEMNSKIRIDKVTNKIGFVVKKSVKIDLINLKNDYIPNVNTKLLCKTKLEHLERLEYSRPDNIFNILTNCENGELHNWILKKDDMVCSKCNKMYSELIKKFNEKNNMEENKTNIEKLKYIYLTQLAKIYCLDGTVHDIETGTTVCSKCKVNIDTKQYSVNELLKLDKNLTEKENKLAYDEMLKMKKQTEKKESKNKDTIEIINKLNSRFEKYTNNKLSQYIDTFIDKLVKLLGTKIKINNVEIYLKDTLYIVSNDYLGNEIKKSFTILSSSNTIIYEDNNEYFKKNVMYYQDKINKVYVYYDSITLNYLGYSSDKKKYTSYNSNTFIQKIPSLKETIEYLGLSNRFQNVSKIDFNNEKSTNELIKMIIRNRINNMKQIINNSLSIIEKVKNNIKTVDNTYNDDMNRLINEFNKFLKNFNVTNKEGKKKIFKNINTINNNITLLPINDKVNVKVTNNYLDSNILLELNNNDIRLIYYYLYNLERLLDYNELSNIKVNIAYFIVKMILYSSQMYAIPIENLSIRRFEFMLANENPYIDDSVRIVGLYQDLVNVEELDDAVMREKEMEAIEEMTALDIDDYEEDDLYDDYDVMDERMDNIYD